MAKFVFAMSRPERPADDGRAGKCDEELKARHGGEIAVGDPQLAHSLTRMCCG